MYSRIILALAVLELGRVSSAPRENSKLENLQQISKDQAEQLDLHVENKSNETTTGQRQKRWFNYYGYGFPPVNPIIYPNQQNPISGSYEDPFSQIYRRLQDFSSSVRQPAFPQNLPQFPFFFPVIFVPASGCTCSPSTPSPQTPQMNNTTPGLNNRFPAMEDTNQNWGIVVDESARPTVKDIDYEDDGRRPISFEPVPPIAPVNRPAPPVEHGSNQAGGATTFRPAFSATVRPINRPTSTTMRPIDQPTVTTTQRPATSATFNPLSRPSVCDGAVLSCCHQPRVTYDCFVGQGCPDPTSYGNPCDPLVIVRVIERFQRFYGQRT